MIEVITIGSLMYPVVDIAFSVDTLVYKSQEVMTRREIHCNRQMMKTAVEFSNFCYTTVAISENK